MARVFHEVNWLAVIVASLVYFVLGVPWFSPASLGPRPLLASFAASLSTAILAGATQSNSLGDGVILGLVVALGYSVAVAGVDAISPSHPAPARLFITTGSYHLVGLIAVAMIVTKWRTTS